VAASVYDILASAGPGPHRVSISEGVVTIDEITVTIDPDTGNIVVDVYAPDFIDPNIRVINPPRYLPDPDGTVELGRRKWRDDPMGALAHLIMQHGGTRAPLRGMP
jgi:hypothetical protein